MMKKLSLVILFVCFASSIYACEITELYKKDHDEYIRVWKEEVKNFKSCLSSKKTKQFLLSSIAMAGNASESEAYYDVIEENILKNPMCVLDAINELSVNDQDQILDIYILRPLYHEIVDIENSLSKKWNENKYNHIRNTFLRLKNEIYK